MSCFYLITPKGSGIPWCTRHRRVAHCTEECQAAAKRYQLRMLYQPLPNWLQSARRMGRILDEHAKVQIDDEFLMPAYRWDAVRQAMDTEIAAGPCGLPAESRYGHSLLTEKKSWIDGDWPQAESRMHRRVVAKKSVWSRIVAAFWRAWIGHKPTIH